jgi:hypothetical protein
MHDVPGLEGVHVSGSGNVLRDSEIAGSAGSGVTLAGTGNALVNCFVHDTDTFGAYACGVRLSGARHLVSHNTVRGSGRDCLQYGGSGHLIQYNDISDAGRICHDTGVLYQSGCDGGGTQICHNWVHDVRGALGQGIYLDNYTSNYLVHHNVVWGISGNAIQLNHPGNFNMVFHNTVFGRIESLYSPWLGTRTLFGSFLANNLVSEPPRLKPKSGWAEAATVREAMAPPARGFDPARGAPRAALDRGVPLPGINDGFAGPAPDCGAYESGQPPWRAGHDFARPPRPVYAPPESFWRNYLANGSFSDPAGKAPGGWRVAAGEAAVKPFPGFNDPPADGRMAVFGGSLRLAGEVEARVEQDVAGLRAGADFVFAAYVRCEGAQEVVLSVRGRGSELASARHSSAEPAVWRHVEASFRLAAPGPVTVVIAKPGGGAAYVDDAGLVPVWTGGRAEAR